MAKKPKMSLRGGDLRKVLNRPVAVAGDGDKKYHPSEAGVRNDLTKALAGDMAAAKRLIKLCVKFGILEPVTDEIYWPGQLEIPEQWDAERWHAHFDKQGHPPWSGAHDGFTDEGRALYKFWKKHGRYR